MVVEEREREKETYGLAARYSLMCVWGAGGWLPIVTAQIHMGMGGIVWG